MPKELSDILRRCLTAEFYELVNPVLRMLTRREREILKLRYGIGDGYFYKQWEVGRVFNVSTSTICRIEKKAISKLEDPSRLQRLVRYLEDHEGERHEIEVREVLADVKELTPHLIVHLKSHHEDITKIPPDVFECLVAEFLASRGFDEVKLVGRDPHTSADILAIRRDEAAGARVRYFVEVKRVSERIGVGVIDRVMGAIVQERPKWGWHLGMLVSTAGFSEFRKYTRRELELRGIILKDKDDVLGWLRDYKPSDKGLWLPADCRIYVAPQVPQLYTP